eukprot:5800429-Prymnesium_polylepis.1
MARGGRGRGSWAGRPASRTGTGRRDVPRAAPFGGWRAETRDMWSSPASRECTAASLGGWRPPPA